MIHSIPSNPCSETLVEPKLIPPVHSNEVAEPLMRKLMCNHIDDSVLVLLIRRILVEEDGGCAICDETPILHGTV